MSLDSICWRMVSGLSLIGLGLATYLSVLYVSGHAPACGSGGCGAVTTSEYARFLGIPVAMIGVAGYSALLLGSLAVAAYERAWPLLKYGLILFAAMDFLFSAYLTATQMFFIHEFCVYCLTSASLMTLILALTTTAVLVVRSEGEVR